MVICIASHFGRMKCIIISLRSFLFLHSNVCSLEVVGMSSCNNIKIAPLARTYVKRNLLQIGRKKHCLCDLIYNSASNICIRHRLFLMLLLDIDLNSFSGWPERDM